MSSSITEHIRSCLEDIERLEKLIIKHMMHDPKTHKDTIKQSHLVNTLLEEIMTRRNTIEKLLRDNDGMWHAEKVSMAGKGNAILQSFAKKVTEMKEYHQLHAAHLQLQTPIDLQEHPIDYTFNGEEMHGKCLDLNRFFNLYVNLPLNKAKLFKETQTTTTVDKPVITMQYMDYLNSFTSFANQSGKDKQYLTYVEELLAYLINFFRRVQPLFDLDSKLENVIADFHTKWNDKSFRKWENDVISSSSNSSSNNNDDNDNNNADTDDNDVAMKELDKTSSDLYCNACEKVFAKQTVFDNHLKGKKHLRAKKRKEKNEILQKQILLIEYQINQIGQLLEEQIETTKINVEKKHARTYEEMEADLYEESDSESDSEDEEEDVRIGIKNYPTGWDGKPIPYWLYKLHGLGIEYKCEICGNTSYWGRRAFERHFQEWRHAHGMRCLGIPNTKHFQDVTKINDALELWKKIKKDSEKGKWKADEDEECEDDDGNVMSKKAFNDLKRQGLL